jgi:predicted secreted hydrolase
MNPLVLAAAVVASAAAARAATPVEFPRDHGNHPDAAVEWWYYTGHLQDASRREYGFQLTFFRAGEIHLAHFAWTDAAAGRFTYEEKSHLGLPGIASSETGRLDVANEDWSAREERGAHRLHAAGRGWELDLALRPSKPPVLHGESGVSRKGPGANDYSHYVSITRLQVSGTWRRGERREAMTGTAWFDHEWGPGALPEGASGWDWFAVQLDDGSDLMLYRIRGPDGRATPYSSGTYVPASGAPVPLRWPDVRLAATGEWVSPKTRARYPSGWKIAIDPLRLDLAIHPLVRNQELTTERSTGVTYWEGACRVRGTFAGRPVTGRGYAELTGYAGRDVPGSSGR